MHQTLAAQMCSCMAGPVRTKKVYDSTAKHSKIHCFCYGERAWSPVWCTNHQWLPLPAPKGQTPLWQFPAHNALQSGWKLPGSCRWQGKQGELGARAAFPDKYTRLAVVHSTFPFQVDNFCKRSNAFVFVLHFLMFLTGLIISIPPSSSMVTLYPHG